MATVGIKIYKKKGWKQVRKESQRPNGLWMSIRALER